MPRRIVHVFSADQKQDLGTGIYLGETTLRKEVKAGNIEGPLEGLAKLIADEPTPKIRLQSGELVYGCTCWWVDVEPTQN